MPQRRAFQIPDNWMDLSQEEKNALLEEVATTIEGDLPQAPPPPPPPPA